MDKKLLFDDISEQISFSAEVAIKQLGTGEDDRTFEVIASTPAIDRDGETIDQRGWDLTNFAKNPVILFGHNYWSLPIGKGTEWSIEEGMLRLKGVFASEKANPVAENVFQLVKEGILKAVSVGFIARERVGNQITKAELLEVSFVPVPSNPEALSMLAAKGFSPSDIKLLTGEFEKKDEEPTPPATDEVTPPADETPDTEVTPPADEAPKDENKEEDTDNPDGAKAVKSGRTISAKTEANIKTAIDALKNASSALEALLNIGEDDESADSAPKKATEFDGSNPSKQGLDVSKMADSIIAGLKSDNPKEQKTALKIVYASVEVALRNLKGN